MSYRLMYTEKSARQIRKMDPAAQRLITTYLRKLENLEEPRSKGKALSAHLKGFWRYRIGDYRAICEINDDEGYITSVPINPSSRWQPLSVARK